MELQEKSLITLELPGVLELLARQAVSLPGKERALELRPSFEPGEVRRRQGETSAAKLMIRWHGAPGLADVRDVRSALERAERGGMLNLRELLDIAGVLKTARTAKLYASGDRDTNTEIDYLFERLRANKFLEERITSSIMNEEELSDNASPELSDIRRLIRAANGRVREALQKIISSPGYAKALQEPIITQRSDRYVIPVKAEYRNSIQGLVHDVSSSGATLFIEPLAAVRANNEIRELQVRERLEIERVLMELSAECAAHGEDIARDFELLVVIDLIFAKAKLSFEQSAHSPEQSERNLSLRKARHPLLSKDTVVPIDIDLGESFDSMIITGPNTGGKTVTLKTLGLLSAMAQCGLHVPAAEGSTLPVFGRILADIGDEQSIEQSLSTFSSHMTNIVSILAECGEGTLVLLDELGAGTDPVEGAALAMSIIDNVRSRGAFCAATTHYSELKVYATVTPGVVNASCEFDVETLRPTYRLLVGMPGKSNAFAISKRLGLAEDIIEGARGRIGTENASFEETLTKLEEQRQRMEHELREAEELRRAAHASSRRADKLRRELSVRLDKAEEKGRREAERIIEQARETTDGVLEELKRLRLEAERGERRQEFNESVSGLQRSLNEAEAAINERSGRAQLDAELAEGDLIPRRPIVPGDTVEIISMGIRAEVISISPGRVLTLQAGIMRVTAKESEVRLAEGGGKTDYREVVRVREAQLRSMPASSELDLRGMSIEEATLILERFIDEAVMARLETVRVIHGKGTGALRSAVQGSLRTNKLVGQYRLGRFGEGETGVTIVELK